MPSLILRLLCALVVAAAQEPNITRCTTGAANISRKAFHVQVCNLFGGTCFINHPKIQDCATESLSIASGECKLYPIFEYEDNSVRSGSNAEEELSTVNDLGCSVFISNGDARFSGACAAVQCALGDGYVGPALSGSGPTRDTGVTDTAAATWLELSLVELPDEAKQIKNVFLYRTGNYVATFKRTYTWSTGGVEVDVGQLPTSNGNNYGPVECTGQNLLMRGSIATEFSAEDLRMCGNTGKWTYYNAINLLMDASYYATYSNNAGITTGDLNIAAVPFLDGKSAYRSGAAMADPRAVMLHSGATATTAVLMTSETIEPLVDFTGEVAGTWRNYGVVFYCDDYARTDLTTCTEANRKMFYVADPNPNEEYGTSASSIGGGTATSTPALGDGFSSGPLQAVVGFGFVGSLALHLTF